MKNAWRILFLVVIPVAIGLILIITGNYDAGSKTFAIGVPVTFVASLLIWFLIPEKKNNKDSKDGEASNEEQPVDSNPVELTEKEKEQIALDKINSSHFAMSEMNKAQYEAYHVKKGMKNATPLGIAFGLTFFFILVALAVTATVLVIKQIFIGGIICVAIFACMIIFGLITAFTRKHISLHGNIDKAKKILNGRVRACILSSSTNVKSGNSTRISNVIYAVHVNADNGSVYTAFSREFYDDGEPIIIAILPTRIAKIVTEEEIEQRNSLIKK